VVLESRWVVAAVIWRDVLVVVIVVGGAASARADSAPAQPDTLYGPALSLGYDFARRGAIGFNFHWAPEDAPQSGGVDQRLAAELEIDLKIFPKWLFSASLPVALWIEDGTRDGDDRYLGNLALWATRSFEPEYAARSFLGVLPSLTIGAVLPMRNRALGTQTPAPLYDQYDLYKRDTAGLLLGGHVRLDLFVRNGILFQTGPEVQILAEGNVLICWQTLLGFGPWPWSDRVRIIGEYDYLRETGRADALISPNGRMLQDGVRHTLRLGLSAAVTRAVVIDVRRDVRTFPDVRDGWSLSAHYEW